MRVIVELSPKFEKLNGIMGAGSAHWSEVANASDYSKLHGTFAIIKETENEIELVCDHIRSIALFYYINKDVDKNVIIISDHPDYIVKHAKTHINKKLQEEYELFFYVTEDETMLDGVFTVLPGQIVKISKSDASITKHQYFKWKFSGSDTRSIDLIAKEFDDILNNVFTDMLERVNGRPIVIPLSGGLDSRTIVSKCVELGYKDITAFTYGRSGFCEIENAKKIADSLKIKKYYQVICDEQSKCKKWLENDEFHQTFHYSALYCNRVTSGVYGAWQEVRDRGGIPSDAVFISGSALDFVAGSHLPALNDTLYNENDVFEFLYESHKLKRNRKLKASMRTKWNLTPPPQTVRKKHSAGRIL